MRKLPLLPLRITLGRGQSLSVGIIIIMSLQHTSIVIIVDISDWGNKKSTSMAESFGTEHQKREAIGAEFPEQMVQGLGLG